MNSSEKIFDLIKKRNITAKALSDATGISTGNISDWKKGKANPSYGAIVKIAKYFNVSEEYLQCLTDDPTPAGERLVIPDELKGVQVAFHRGEFEDLTQEEVNKLAEYAKFIKTQREAMKK